MITRRKFIAGSAAVAAGSAIAGPVGFRLPGAFTPRNISGLKLWLDASQITGLNDGDAVGTWADLSGNGNDATQGTGSKKPTYETNEINGRPGVFFDGVDDILDFVAPVDLGAAYTLFTVFKTPSGGGTYAYIVISDGGGYDFLHRNNGLEGLKFANSTSDDAGSVLYAPDTPYIANYRQASNSLRVNGAVSAITHAAFAGNNNRTHVGARSGSASAAVLICSVISYSVTLSLAEVQQVEAYLNSRYAAY